MRKVISYSIAIIFFVAVIGILILVSTKNHTRYYDIKDKYNMTQCSVTITSTPLSFTYNNMEELAKEVVCNEGVYSWKYYDTQFTIEEAQHIREILEE